MTKSSSRVERFFLPVMMTSFAWSRLPKSQGDYRDDPGGVKGFCPPDTIPSGGRADGPQSIVRAYRRGSVTPCWPWYLPPRSR